jgi:hypothetical protein
MKPMNIIQNNDFWQNPVEILPYNQAFPQTADHKQFDEKRVILSQDHDILFGVHNAKSFLIPHLEALQVINDSIEAMFDESPKIEVTSVKHGATIRAKIALDQFPSIEMPGNDVSKIHLLFGNSYARPGDFKLSLGVYRLICSNGATIGQTITGFNSRQLIDEGFNSTSLQNKVARVIDDAKFLYDLWQSWQGISLGYEQALELFGKKFSEGKLESILIPDLFPRNMWDCYNDFTAFSTHDSKTASSQINTDNIISSLFYGRSSPLREIDREVFESVRSKKEEIEDAEFEDA